MESIWQGRGWVCVMGWGEVGGEEEEVDGGVGEDKTCLRESYITLKFSPELCIEINRRINDQISLWNSIPFTCQRIQHTHTLTHQPTHHLIKIPSKSMQHDISQILLKQFAFVLFCSERLISQNLKICGFTVLINIKGKKCSTPVFQVACSIWRIRRSTLCFYSVH